MNPHDPLSEAGSLALDSLAAYPSRTTVSGISNGPWLVRGYGPQEVHAGLLELAAQGLAIEQHGRWSITPLGREVTASGRAATAVR